MNAALQAIQILLGVTRLLREMGINYQEVIAAQAQADAEGRELSQAEIQSFLDESQDAIDQL